MITLNYKQLNGEFFQALNELRQIPMPIKSGYALGKIISKVDQAMKSARDEHKAMIVKLAHLDEKGNVKMKPSEGGEMLPDFLSDSHKKEYDQNMETFFKTEIKIEQNKISIQALGDAQLSPESCDALDPIFTTLATV